MNTIKIKKINPKAKLPYKATSGAAGYDLWSCLEESVVIKPGEQKEFATGLAFELPDYFEGQIRPRSGWAFKYNITVANSPGSLDCDFRAELKVCLVNHSKQDFVVEPNERIAQIIFNRLPMVEFKEVSELSETKRGLGGFGSTGTK